MKPVSKLTPGMTVPPFQVKTLHGKLVPVPNSLTRFVHLQFRRFAGCPLCNTHLRSFVKRAQELEQAGIHEIIFFHSSPALLNKYEHDIPFDLVADPDKKFYRQFGVETSAKALFHPAIIKALFKSLKTEKIAFPKVENGRLGLPADILIDSNGQIIASKYGLHAYDHWEVSELLELANNRAPIGKSSQTTGSNQNSTCCKAHD
ncbi:peroxiredoxin-like family protein [Pedosphaera parvula]|uniref:Alkyl hydroperoxide reductase/ Thiol specific antioxidant/ Mal allergen n=1 Tax=Pedosphaera parvula (strain Ellin514) TaxID=320771 RepID=B9XLD4_PEDPL|nr:peroxiredoxin-like family protein [Pedosphaera parvula]EEF59337.1 alkyl hydroperoxide reductase/ Thiol specific antioxidant/ Mal allergen [Pedosphaera parvula Ellin514]